MGPGQALALSQTAPVMTRSVWQCGSGYQELTEHVEMLKFDFSQPLASSQGNATVRCGALVFKCLLQMQQQAIVCLVFIIS